MTEPSNRTSAYATGLLSIARAEGNLAEVEDELFRFSRIFESNDELRSTLSDPHLPAERRAQVVEDILEGRSTPTTLAIVSLIVTTGRAADLPKIVGEFVSLSAAETGSATAEVRTAVALTDDQKGRLAAALTAAVGRPIELKVVVDPSVVGGVVAQIGDSVIDGSVRTRLNQLREVF